MTNNKALAIGLSILLIPEALIIGSIFVSSHLTALLLQSKPGIPLLILYILAPTVTGFLSKDKIAQNGVKFGLIITGVQTALYIIFSLTSSNPFILPQVIVQILIIQIPTLLLTVAVGIVCGVIGAKLRSLSKK